MYIEKTLRRGYNEYTREEVENGYGSMMDVGVLLMEPGDAHTFHEETKEVAWILLQGKAVAEFDGKTAAMHRPNPFDYGTYCLLQAAGSTSSLAAVDKCKVFVQKTANGRKYPTHLYTPDQTDTWRRGAGGECGGACERDVRTSFDYENAPHSNMVLGEVVNLPGKWSSYPPHSHPQPEVYFYHFEKDQGFGAGWVDDEVVRIRNNGLAVITKKPHPMVMAPGYACCYVWGIRHLPGNPWEKTRIDDPAHTWMLEPGATFWNGGGK
ncbi:MAG: 5-deoxy-glucuronate isomerase [Planctomycetota bacterium]|jgi:5-deoxy-glucuronate isomerase|nr:5-deoxy-glucuronate isomerase [Planctomycetota bacterium]